MTTSRACVVVISLLALSGACAHESPQFAAAPVADCDDIHGEPARADHEPAATTSRTLRGAEQRDAVVRLRWQIDEIPRPPRTRPVDITLHRADLENAMRLLAEAGGFNLIIDKSLNGTVSVTLKHVEPYEALAAIASAQKASVVYENGIVFVSAL